MLLQIKFHIPVLVQPERCVIEEARTPVDRINK